MSHHVEFVGPGDTVRTLPVVAWSAQGAPLIMLDEGVRVTATYPGLGDGWTFRRVTERPDVVGVTAPAQPDALLFAAKSEDDLGAPKVTIFERKIVGWVHYSDGTSAPTWWDPTSNRGRTVGADGEPDRPVAFVESVPGVGPVSVESTWFHDDPDAATISAAIRVWG